MKNLIIILAIVFCSCGLTKDLDEYVERPAMLIKVEKVHRFVDPRDEQMTLQKKQTWEFLDNNYQIIIYVNISNTEEIGTRAFKNRRR